MLKSQVPFYFCSIAFFVGVPSAGNSKKSGIALPANGEELAAPMNGKAKAVPMPGKTIPMPMTGKTISMPTTGKTAPMPMTGKAISMPKPGQKGMTFVSAYIRNNDDCLTSVKERSEAPFAIIDSVLNHYGLPLQLKYLAVIESELKASARSRVGARGPWQLMPATAHVLGLKVNRGSDERTNYYKSTVAAAEYLRDLHREFKDWLLVLAAYNGGPGPVYRAIHQSHSRNFWTLERYLPAESRQHVKKFIATAYYFEGPGRGTKTAISSGAATTMIATRATGSSLPSQHQTAAPVRTVVPVGSERRTGVQESADEKFNRLMRESAVSLKESKDLLVEKEN